MQIAGVLVLAAGVPGAFEHGDFTVMVTSATSIMRIALVGAVAARRARATRRAARSRCATRSAISVVQVGWVVRLALGRPASAT